jgi:acyl dehydratase
MQESSVVQDDPLAEARQLLGRESSFAGVDEVTRSDIRRKLEVYCFDCPLHYDEAVARAHGYRTIVAPAAMTPLWAMPAYWSPGEPSFYAPGLKEKVGGIHMDVPNPYPKGFNAASEWEYFEPVYPGDRLHGSWKLTEVKPRETRLGDGVFLSFESTVFKQTGERVAIHRNTGYRYKERADRVEAAQAAPREAAPAADAPPPENPAVDWSQQVAFEDVEVGSEAPPYHLWLNYQRIVMSVAVDRMFSGIHHNRDAARAAGMDDIIFNTRGYDMLFEITLRRWIGLDGRIRKMGPFRMTKNSHPGDTITCHARVTNKELRDGQGLLDLEIWVDGPRGEAARGQAVVSLPVRGT